MSSLFDLPFEEPGPDDVDAGLGNEDPGPVGREPEPAPADPDPGARPRRSPGAPEPRAEIAPATAAESQPAAPLRRVLTISELTGRIRTLLEEQFFEVWVEGELSNCRVWNTGHMYFTLKDGGAQVQGVMFRSSLRLLRFKPQDGLRVVARGRISVYEPKGEYQIVCDYFEPEGVGARQLAFEQLKEKLSRAGLFDAARKRPLPALPRKIGVVTSLDGAAVRDIIKVLRRRYANAHIVIRPTRVQGEGAAMDIYRAMSAIARVKGVDVVIVGRGGGSIEDLWAFNEEVVARAIAGCPVPTISAVGHESDFTIADFVADVRAPTPSAAAEMVVARKDDFCARIDRMAHRLESAMTTRVHRLESRLRQLEARPGLAGTRGRLALKGRRTAELGHALHRALREHMAGRQRAFDRLRRTLDGYDLRRRLGAVRTRLVAADGRMHAAAARRHHQKDALLRSTVARLESLSPLAVLGRGYAVCWSDDRTRIIRDAASVAAGDRVRVTLDRGELECDVRSAGPASSEPAGPDGHVT